jgi:hypothetical protein
MVRKIRRGNYTGSIYSAGRGHAAAPTGGAVGTLCAGVAAQAGLRIDANPIQSATEPRAKLPKIMNIAL